MNPAPEITSDCGTTPLTDCLGANLNVCEAGNQQTWKERIVQALLDQAVEGNLRAIQEVWNRIEGKPGHPEGRATTTDSAPLAVTNEVARKILKAGRGDDDTDHDDDETEEDDGDGDRSDT